MFTRYGYKTFGTIIISVLVMFSLAFFINNLYIQYIFYAIGSFFLIFSANFFRDPKRITPPGSDFVVSPADGKVLSISEIDDKRFLAGPAYQISIFMSPL
ncbi:MAG: phosphatidylserine decarboxylase, partial [Melioribacteraceae bacterium]|nr:phosphatidylserine decarboxylase [Melioribacteraceae bacterium]